MTYSAPAAAHPQLGNGHAGDDQARDASQGEAAESAKRTQWRTAAPWLAGLALVIVAAGAVAWPWLSPRFSYYVDDGGQHAVRLYLLTQMLRKGVLFPRWWPDLGLGFGTPVFVYYSPAIYYLGAFFRLLGATNYRAFQWTGAAIVLLGATGAYTLGCFVLRHWLGAAILAAAYVASPYAFITNLYNRSAFPEALGLGLLPWLLLAGWLAVRRSRLGTLALASMLALAVLAHSVTAMVMCGVLVLWLIGCLVDTCAAERRPAALSAITGLGVGLALCAFLWLPALAEQGAVHTELGKLGNLNFDRWLYDPFRPTEKPIDMVVDLPYEITRGWPFDRHWVYPHATAGLTGPAKPSLAQVLLLVSSSAAGAVGLAARRRNGGHSAATRCRPRAALLGLAVVVPVLWLMQFTWSEPIWRYVPLLSTLQFPYRLLGTFSLALAVTAAAIFAWLARRGQQQWVLAVLLVLFVAVNAIGQRPGPTRMGDMSKLPPLPAQLRGLEGDRLGAATTTTGEFLPRSVQYEEPLDMTLGGRQTYESAYPSGGWLAGSVWPYAGQVTIQQVWRSISWTRARVVVEQGSPSAVAFHTLVFPGWRAFVDGRPTPLRAAPFDPSAHISYGFAIVDVPPGAHTVEIDFGSTIWQMMGVVISLAGLAFASRLLVLGVFSERSRLADALGRAAIAVIGALAAVYLTSALIPLWRAPIHVLRPQPSIALDVLQAAVTGQGSISAPDANGLGAFVAVRTETIGEQARDWLYMHPPSQVRLPLDVPANAVFQAGLALDPGAWDQPRTDGVRFIVEVIDAAGQTHTVLDQPVQPQTHPEDRGWRFAEADLGAYAGQHVTLVLRTDGMDTPEFDWSGWATPVVYSDTTARYPPRTHVEKAAQTPPAS